MKKIFMAFALLLLPFMVNAQSISSTSGAFITLQSQGSGGTIRMGQTGELARFRLSNRTGKNLNLNSLQLRNYGTANLSESFENVVVQNNGQVISRASRLDRKNVSISFDNVQIGRGDSLVLSVMGRLIYAQSGETVELGLRRKEDIRASIVGLDNFSVECRDCEDVRSRSKRLRAGGIYLNSRSAYRSSRYYGSNSYYTSLRNRNYNTNRSTSRRNTSRNYYRSPIGRQTFSQGAKGITFFSTYLNSKSPFRVDGIFLSVAGGTQVSDKNNNRQSNDIEDLEETFSDFTLYVNGQREDSTDSFTRRNGQTGLLFNTTMDIPAGSQVLLTGRITNNGVTGDKIKFSLGRNGLIDPVYLYNGRNIDLGNINGGTTSNFSSTLNQPLSISK